MNSQQILIQNSQKLKIKTEKKIKSIVKDSVLKSELKNLAIFAGLLALAVSGRVALQFVPSVEPIIPIAIAAGLVLGPREGFALGGSAFIISNFFVWGLQGPWTIFQALGAAVPGAAAGFLGKIKTPNSKDLMVLSILGTVFFEIAMNVSGGLMGIGLLGGLFALPLYFLASLPFSAVHIVSNIAFAKACSPILKLRGENNGKIKIVSISRADGSGTTTVRLLESN